jgi:hypothetical protein
MFLVIFSRTSGRRFGRSRMERARSSVNATFKSSVPDDSADSISSPPEVSSISLIHESPREGTTSSRAVSAATRLSARLKVWPSQLYSTSPKPREMRPLVVPRPNGSDSLPSPAPPEPVPLSFRPPRPVGIGLAIHCRKPHALMRCSQTLHRTWPLELFWHPRKSA